MHRRAHGSLLLAVTSTAVVPARTSPVQGHRNRRYLVLCPATRHVSFGGALHREPSQDFHKGLVAMQRGHRLQEQVDKELNTAADLHFALRPLQQLGPVGLLTVYAVTTACIMEAAHS